MTVSLILKYHKKRKELCDFVNARLADVAVVMGSCVADATRPARSRHFDHINRVFDENSAWMAVSHL